MASLVVKATVQSVVLAAISNVLAQLFQAFKEDKPLEFDTSTLLFFIVFNLVSCPPNVLFQILLEEQFPANKTDAQGRKRLSKTNTTKKLLLDQTVSATLNTVGYIAAIAAFRGKDSSGIADQIRMEFWPLLQAGWKLWPLVAILNFSVIPLEHRTLFGSIVGLFWNIYLSLLASE